MQEKLDKEEKLFLRERYPRLRRDWQNALERLERLQSGKERVTFAGRDYTDIEIANVLRELDWYEEWFAKNLEGLQKEVSHFPLPPSAQNQRLERALRPTVPSPLNPRKEGGGGEKRQPVLRPPPLEEKKQEEEETETTRRNPVRPAREPYDFELPSESPPPVFSPLPSSSSSSVVVSRVIEVTDETMAHLFEKNKKEIP